MCSTRLPDWGNECMQSRSALASEAELAYLEYGKHNCDSSVPHLFHLESDVGATWKIVELMHYFLKRFGIPNVIALLLVYSGCPAIAQTLGAVKERGTLNCGVSQGLPGFSSVDEKKAWTGFDVDFCRAVAAAIFDDPNKVTFMPLDTTSRFTALQSKSICCRAIRPGPCQGRLRSA